MAGSCQIPPSSFLCYAQHSLALMNKYFLVQFEPCVYPCACYIMSSFYCLALHPSLLLWVTITRQTPSDGKALFFFFLICHTLIIFTITYTYIHYNSKTITYSTYSTSITNSTLQYLSNAYIVTCEHGKARVYQQFARKSLTTWIKETWKIHNSVLRACL